MRVALLAAKVREGVLGKEEITAEFERLQARICARLSAIDGSKHSFTKDHWPYKQGNEEGEREGGEEGGREEGREGGKEGGGGCSRILSKGCRLARAGVNVSAIYKETSPELQKAFDLSGGSFYATGLSIVIHPLNPYVPIIHMNVRYFELSDGREWFGGGIDLTPHYVDEAEAITFHQTLQSLCKLHKSVSNYEDFKRWADDYFYLSHRKETRGVGGIFFDRLQQKAKNLRWAFVKDLAESFLPIYEPLFLKNCERPYGPKEEEWQRLRRGRYVEFNLIHDAGTRFGLLSGGRTESILMSLPPEASWSYAFQVEKNSPEAHTSALLKKGIPWADYANYKAPYL